MKPALGAAIVLFGAVTVFGQAGEREQTHARIASLKSELRVLEKSLLPPAPSDLEPFAEFISNPGRGVIRLMPRKSFEKAAIISINGGGSYYSFKRLTHEYGYGNDLALEQEMFSVGFAGADYGLMAVLEADLDEITPEHQAIQFLANLKAAAKEPDARVEQRRASTGVVVGGVTFKNRQKAELGKTYVLRSINYGNWDLFVSFQTLRKDTDGSWILVWKLLKEFDKPELERTPQVN